MIICNFNLFDKEQKIFSADPNTGEMNLITVSDFENLGTNIGKVCQMEDTYQIHLYGSQEYLTTIVIPQLTEYMEKDFNNKKLDIEVN